MRCPLFFRQRAHDPEKACPALDAGWETIFRKDPCDSKRDDDLKKSHHALSGTPQFPNGIVSSVSFVSTTNTARSLAGFVLLALALTPWRSPGNTPTALTGALQSPAEVSRLGVV